MLSAALPDVGGRLYRVPLAQPSPLSSVGGWESVHEISDLTSACADPSSCVVQGKAHVPLVEDESGEHVYFASHVGFYTEVDGMETIPVTPGRPAHLGPYPGGCVLRLHVPSGALTPLCRMPDCEGVITMACDLPRKRVYCLLWPSGRLGVVAQPPSPPSSSSSSSSEWALLHTLDYPGRGDGEASHPRTGKYRPVCRAMAVDPRTGKLYFSNSAGDVLEYDGGRSGKEPIIRAVLSGTEGLVRDYFGHYDPAKPGSMGYHWRQVHWVEGHRGGCIVGMHGNSGYLFELLLPTEGLGGEGRPSLQLVERLTSLPSKRIGLSDQFSCACALTHSESRARPLLLLYDLSIIRFILATAYP